MQEIKDQNLNKILYTSETGEACWQGGDAQSNKRLFHWRSAQVVPCPSFMPHRVFLCASLLPISYRAFFSCQFCLGNNSRRIQGLASLGDLLCPDRKTCFSVADLLSHDDSYPNNFFNIFQTFFIYGMEKRR